MNLKKLNTYVGWMVFLIATVVYFMTIEETTSLWDCGEYITTAYKLEVGHPPGAPLFMMFGRIFSLFAGGDTEMVAYMINGMSALSSSFTILFLFWTITLLGKKIALKNGGELSEGKTLAIIGSAIVGSLAYTFTDSFWFSAVEGEVYAMASLFTAIVFWAILKWDDELRFKQAELQETGRSSLRWIILIMFILGLAIGVHLLGLLAIPAIAYVIYFKHYEKVTFAGFALTGVIGVVTLGFIQEGIIPGTIKIASAFERSFVNNFGLPFNTGTIVFFVLLLGLVVIGIKLSKRAKSPVWNTAVMSFAVLMIGYSCFAMIVIRSNANTPLDENDPENLVTLHSYLKREQYGQFPLVYGQYFNSKQNQRDQFGDGTPQYLRRFVIERKGQDLKGFKKKEDADAYKASVGGNSKVVEKYYMVSNGEDKWPTYEQNTIFPRMYAQQIPQSKKDAYKSWSGYADNLAQEKRARRRKKNKKNIGSDGNRVPTFGENMHYFMSYQVNYMYWRYFLWNFSGRQNDIQGHGNIYNGNWQTGFNFIDSERIGDQTTAPNYTSNNPSNNKFYLLPLILGIIGMIFHFIRAKKDAFVVLLLFFFTGLAIVVYLNQKPMEPRERDYAYAGSFYAFAIWIGLSVYGLYEAAKNMSAKKWLVGLAGFGALALIFLIAGVRESDYSTLLSWIMIGLIGGGMLLVMSLLKKSDGKLRAVVALVLTIGAPIIMGVQGWDDHDRSERTTARDLARNYLIGSGKNGILFANGDNDTFPLWYMQEVEGYKTDVRVCNLSLLGTDWYTEQMTFRTYESDPLPISFNEEQYRMSEGYLDQIIFQDIGFLSQRGWDGAKLQGIFDAIRNGQEEAFDLAYRANIKNVQRTLLSKQPDQSIIGWVNGLDSIYNGKPYSQFYSDVFNKVIASGLIQGKEAEAMYKSISSDGLPAVNIKEVSNFLRNEANITYIPEYRSELMVVPFPKIYIPVEKDTVMAYNYADSSDFDKIQDRIEFRLQGSLMKDDIMMLETIAHNDWKRTIHFTSPNGSEVTSALRDAGYVAMEGMVYKLNPFRTSGINGYGYINLATLYDNLMNNYNYGGIKNGVLVDYYTRRHIIGIGGYRAHFYIAAKAYLELSDRYTSQISQMSAQIGAMESSGSVDPRIAGQLLQAKSELARIKKEKAALGNAKEKAVALVNRALEEFPIGDVLEFGDMYSGSFITKYAEILYLADAENKEDLATQVADLLDGEMRHYLSLTPDQIKDSKSELSRTFSNFSEFKGYVDSNDPDGKVSGDLKRYFQEYHIGFSEIVSKLQKAGKDISKKDKIATKASNENIGFFMELVNEFSPNKEQAVAPVNAQ